MLHARDERNPATEATLPEFCNDVVAVIAAVYSLSWMKTRTAKVNQMLHMHSALIARPGCLPGASMVGGGGVGS